MNDDARTTTTTIRTIQIHHILHSHNVGTEKNFVKNMNRIHSVGAKVFHTHTHTARVREDMFLFMQRVSLVCSINHCRRISARFKFRKNLMCMTECFCLCINNSQSFAYKYSWMVHSAAHRVMAFFQRKPVHALFFHPKSHGFDFSLSSLYAAYQKRSVNTKLLRCVFEYF